MKTQRRSEDSYAKQDKSPIQSTVYELLIYSVHMMCTIMMHNSTELVKLYPFLPPDNHHSSDVVCWRGGGTPQWLNVIKWPLIRALND